MALLKKAPRAKRSDRPKRSLLSTSSSPAVKLFKRMVKEVPAYKQFLKARKIRPEKISTVEQLASVPSISKENYLRVFAYKDLFWAGTLSMPHIMTSTSGSTGEPFYFARSHDVDRQAALIHERFFLQSSLAKTKPTLVIVCFGMGVWIGGLLTYQAFQHLEKRGHPISIITPGINKSEIFKILRLLAPQYEQLILAGYPPFIKDILDEASERGIDLQRHKVAILFAAEAFTEEFRDYIKKKARIRNVLTDTMNIYGSADLGTMAFETPLAILIRRIAANNSAVFQDIFGQISKTPTLAQFIPAFTQFEESDGELLVSGDSAMPLIRYAIGDNGGVRTYKELFEILRRHGIDLKKRMRAEKIDLALSHLPFVFVYERSDLSTTLYGLQIYPETIRDTLIADTFSPFVTGRFTLVTKYDAHNDQYLEINIEMKGGKEITDALTSRLHEEIIKNLKLKNGEYKELYKFVGAKAEPRLVFWPHEDPRYFRRDIKQRWVMRAQQ